MIPIFNYLAEMGFTLTGDKCRCGSPVVVRGEWTGCWECLTSGEVARRGHNLLTRVKLQAQLNDQERPFWPEGMPL